MHTHTQGVLKESAPNELHPALPVMTRTHVHTHTHTCTHTQGVLKESAPNELHPALPVIMVKPMTADDFNMAGYYNCPVYTNMQVCMSGCLSSVVVGC